MEGWGGCEFLKENMEVKEVDGFEESGFMYLFSQRLWNQQLFRLFGPLLQTALFEK